MKGTLVIQPYVVFGHADNGTVEFPMHHLGTGVWPLNTIQFSNHTQYDKWTGCVVPPSRLTETIQDIADTDKLQTCDVALSDYLGSAEQDEHTLDTVRKIGVANPQAEYFYGPVMGRPEKECIVAPGVTEFYVYHTLPAGSIIAPNLVELKILCERAVNNVGETVAATRELIAQGPEIVLVKHLVHVGISTDRFEILLVTTEQAWHISRPLVNFGARRPVDVGDVMSGLLLVRLLQGASLRQAPEHVTTMMCEMMITTKEVHEYKLQIVTA